MIFRFEPDIEKLERRKSIKGILRAMQWRNGRLKENVLESFANIGQPAVQPLYFCMALSGVMLLF